MRVRQGEHPFLRGISNDDLPTGVARPPSALDGPPASLTRTNAPSAPGAARSSASSFDHRRNAPCRRFSPIVDTGFDLRYSALSEVQEGAAAWFSP